MSWLYLLLSIIGGAVLALQAGVNGELGKRMGTIEAAFVAYSAGTLVLLLGTLIFGKGSVGLLFSFQSWKWFIGILGALYIFIMVVAIPKIGAANAIIAAILGQLVIGMVIDHFGLFGVKTLPINLYRIAGIVLMFISLLLFFKR
ncbi:DMT family transporter [Halobacillus shinanisalinarum]|uniref:DMT family transporter n=1 Tax=Halobacillus shinanisalinarum TaxID=2932258 RepID=A0ABY4GW92_9BACI|nr:DMT family transporter [Halobacillus shinanisalinarum]UOQ92234.1 DMT family transporter [Halobacillus shinanisalinarum]